MTDPAGASRPFDLHRDGFVIGEGCGVLVLEEYEHAVQRDAHIYAEMVGYGLSADAHHITSPPKNGEGAARAMRRMSEDRSRSRASRSTTSTPMAPALRPMTPARQPPSGPSLEHTRSRLAVSSTKGVTGHCMGAAGGIEAAYTVLAIAHGVVPPTANLTTPDPACHLDYVPEAGARNDDSLRPLQLLRRRRPQRQHCLQAISRRVQEGQLTRGRDNQLAHGRDDLFCSWTFQQLPTSSSARSASSTAVPRC